MWIDLSIPISTASAALAAKNESIVLHGHLGTHFDVMNQVFPLRDFELPGVIVHVLNKEEITLDDIDPARIHAGMFIAFHTGWIDRYSYGTSDYFHNHPQLSLDLIEYLLEQGISLIGIDGPGVRRGKEHTPMDQHCADHGVFIIENLCFKDMPAEIAACTFYTFPVRWMDSPGLPCRVAARIAE